MRRLERLHAITEELRRRAPNPVSASDLAARFGVSRRTIERDVEALRLAGVPTYGQVGRRGGTALISAGPSRPVSLSTAEVVSLVAAVKLTEGSPYATAGRSAVEKLLQATNDGDRVRVEELRGRFRVAPGPPRIGRRVLSVVEDAVRTQTVVNISYTDRNGSRTRRSVDPVGFYLDGRQWSLVGWCHLRNAGRLFHLDRITRVDPTPAPAPGHDLDEVLGWVPRFGTSV